MTLEIRLLEPGDLPSLVRCFERGYGTSYTDDTFYDAARLADRLAAGTLRSVVAVDPEGSVVGHMALHVRDAGATTGDAGNTLVDPRHRGQRLVERLALALAARCRDEGFVGFHHYPTTAHAILQKLAVRGGGVECGVLLACIPAATEYRGLAEVALRGRLATVAVYQPLAAAPAREIHPPAPYAAAVAAVAGGAGLERVLRAPAACIERTDSILALRREPRRGLLRVEVRAIGRDLAERVRAALAAEAAWSRLAHVDLPLGDPAVGRAAETLRPLGFFFGAHLPELRDGDVLRLQRVDDPTRAELAPVLVNPAARERLALALSDRAL